MLKTTIILIILLVIFTLNHLTAKDNDSGIWVDLSAIKNIRSLTFGFLGEFHTYEYNKSIERIAIGGKFDWQLTPWISTGLGYMLMNFVHPDANEIRERLYFQLSPEWNTSRFNFNFRERIQVTLYPEAKTKTPAASFWRNRFETIYKGNGWKLEPLTSIEALYHLQGLGLKYFEEVRLTLGANYLMSQHQRLKVYGMYTNGIVQNRYLLGIVYEFTL